MYRKIGLILAVGIIAFVIIGAFVTPYDPEAMDVSAKLTGISPAHIMGCDQFGRDIFSRVLKGSGTTLFVAALIVLIGAGLGTLIGAVTGYFGGIFDEILMRINDVLFSFPGILLALLMISLLGAGKANLIISLGIAFIPSFARIARGEVVRCRNMDYVKWAKIAGISNARIIFVHIFPNIAPVLFSSVLIGFNNAVLAEAGMSFLGVGVAPPDSSLGRMLSEAQGFLFAAPWYAISPGIVIVIMVLSFSMLGERRER